MASILSNGEETPKFVEFYSDLCQEENVPLFTAAVGIKVLAEFVKLPAEVKGQVLLSIIASLPKECRDQDLIDSINLINQKFD